MKRWVLWLVVAAAGCESAEAKLGRLEQEATIACLAAQGRRRTAESMGTAPLARDRIQYARLDSVARESEARCTLAERDLERFLR